jgi:hypothetical protein
MPQHALFQGVQSHPQLLTVKVRLPQGLAEEAVDLTHTVQAYNGELLDAWGVELRGREVEHTPTLVSWICDHYLWDTPGSVSRSLKRNINEFRHVIAQGDDLEGF